jgi:hypothetical protein
MRLNENKLQDQALEVKTLTETQPAPIVDQLSATVAYKGYADLGTKTSEAKWKIIRITSPVGATGVTLTEYADGNMYYDNVWDDRATLFYGR